MDFDELLAKFKAETKPEDAMVAILDHDLLMQAAVWQRVGIQRLGEPVADTWEALWGSVKVDVECLALLIDVPHSVAGAVFKRMQTLRIIYPDGTVPDLVRKVIQKRVNDALKG